MSGAGTQRSSAVGRLWRRNGLVWAALLVLLGITFGTAYVPLGPFNSVLNIGIAAAKASLVVLLFMELWGSPSLLRVTAIAGLVFVLVLFGLTLADTVTRVQEGWVGLSPPTDLRHGAPAPDRTRRLP